MDKVNRLRWIPMIVKAYSDARLRQELMKRGVDLGSTFQERTVDNLPQTLDRCLPVRCLASQSR